MRSSGSFGSPDGIAAFVPVDCRSLRSEEASDRPIHRRNGWKVEALLITLVELMMVSLSENRMRVEFRTERTSSA